MKGSNHHRIRLATRSPRRIKPLTATVRNSLDGLLGIHANDPSAHSKPGAVVA